MSQELSMDFQFSTTIEKAWDALTDSEKLAKWMTENDFKPIVGHRFTFRHQPSEYWDGIVEGEVLEVERPHRLSYKWRTGDEEHTVTWRLEELGNGKVNLHLKQTGFSNPAGVAGAKYGWNAWFDNFEKAL